MKTVCFVPIKLNNQRTPGKNTRLLSDGTPICQLIFNTVLKVSEIDECYCFCSDESIKHLIPSGIHYLKRSSKLDSPETKGNDLVEAFINEIDADIYVMAHVTAPFLSVDTISDCIKATMTSNFDSATTVNILREFLWNDEGPLNYDPSNIIRTQDMPTIYRETTGLYVFKKEVFIKHHRRIGFKPYLKEVGTIEGLDLDYPEDFEIIDSVYSMKKMKEYKY